MKAAGITLSTVGAGGGANPFLEQLATQGGGRFYAAANPASIPDIFLKETQQVSGQQIIEEPFFPIQTSSSPILRGLDQGLPKLLGYNGTTAKPAAQTVLVTVARRPAPRPVAVRPRAVRGVDVRLDRALGQGLAGLARLRPVLLASSSAGRSRARRPTASRRPSTRRTARRRCTSRASRPTARRATSTRRSAVVVGPDLEPHDVALAQVGAGRVRGAARRGRRRAPTRSASRRPSPGRRRWAGRSGWWRRPRRSTGCSGPDEPFLASLRAATGGTVVDDRARAVDARPDSHQPLHRPVAAAAGPGAAAVAARHRAAAGLGRAARARAGAGVGPRARRATARDGAADGDRGEPARGTRAGDRRAIEGVAAGVRGGDGRAAGCCSVECRRAQGSLERLDVAVGERGHAVECRGGDATEPFANEVCRLARENRPEADATGRNGPGTTLAPPHPTRPPTPSRNCATPSAPGAARAAQRGVVDKAWRQHVFDDPRPRRRRGRGRVLGLFVDAVLQDGEPVKIDNRSVTGNDSGEPGHETRIGVTRRPGTICVPLSLKARRTCSGSEEVPRIAECRLAALRIRVVRKPKERELESE